MERGADQTGTLLAAFLRFEPAVTLTVLAAGMSIDSPVCGLRPVRAERWVRSTVSRPETATFSPRVIASTSSSCSPARTESTVEAATSARLAMAETSSALFMTFLSYAIAGAVGSARGRLQPPDAVGAGGVPGPARRVRTTRSDRPSERPDPRHRAMSACGLASGGWFPGPRTTRRPLPYQR